MIGKTHSGKGFGGLTNYLLHGKKADPRPDRVAWTSTRELALEDPKDAALLMRMTAAQGRTDEPLQHLSISLAPGEHLTRQQWEQVIDRTLKDLGLEGHQALVVAHGDTDHEHIHLMVNRVHPETFRAWNRWQDRPRLMASLRAQELDLGLQPTPHVKDPDRLPERLMQAFIHVAEPPFLDFARAEARPIFKDARSWDELHELLAEKGLYLERKGQGLVVTDDHRHVKASSVDRGASLSALEARLGPYEPRRPLLQEVDSDLRGDRRAELYRQVEPARRAQQEAEAALRGAHGASSRLANAREGVRSAIATAYRQPAPVESHYFAHLDQQKALPQLRPDQLGELRGIVLRLPSSIPLGAEGNRALEAAANQLPRFGADYLRAQEDLARAEAHLSQARQKAAQLTESVRPQLAELDQIQDRAATLYERVLSLRPRDQIALARSQGGSQELERAARRRPEQATRPLDSRQGWMQNLSRDLNRALDRRLSRTGISLPADPRTLIEGMAQAIRLGLHPLHAVQALTRGGVPLADAAHVVSLTRAAIRSPARTALWLTAKALGIPSLPVRIATMAWDLVKGQVLSR